MEISKLSAYTQRILGGGEITPEEALELLTVNDEDTPLLAAFADKIRQHFCGNDVDCCAIAAARSGKCSENCSFCAQSAFHHANIPVFPLISTEEIITCARKAKAAGATRFSIVTGGRSVEPGPDFESIIRAIPVIRDTIGIEICCSLGLINKTQLKALKAAGITRYHSNIETAPSYFPSICTTHTFADKERMVKEVI